MRRKVLWIFYLPHLGVKFFFGFVLHIDSSFYYLTMNKSIFRTKLENTSLSTPSIHKIPRQFKVSAPIQILHNPHMQRIRHAVLIFFCFQQCRLFPVRQKSALDDDNRTFDVEQEIIAVIRFGFSAVLVSQRIVEALLQYFRQPFPLL